jgi:hypothetical protein
VQPFVEPAGTYAPGHRGVDLAAGADGVVRAAGPGVVEFAGAVGGARHVVIRHGADVRTGYSYVDVVLVRAGAHVTAGTPIARCCAGDPRHASPSPSLHWSLRVDGRYADPMQLLAPADLVASVHLAPPHGDDWPVDRASAIAMLWDVVRHDAPALLDAALGVAPWWSTVGARDIVVLGRASIQWLDERDECDADPAPLGSLPQEHDLVFVAGINSRSGRGGRSNGFPATRVGYAADDVHWFSYATDGGAYTSADSRRPIRESAALLADQLRARQRVEPGRVVDLVAHSQGGLVVQTYLKLFHDPADPTLPPLGTVVTLSSPHQGAPLAGTAVALAERPVAGALLDHLPGLPPISGSVVDLDPDGALVTELAQRGLPEGVEVVSFATPFDHVVPASATELDGATNAIVDPDGVVGEHSDMTTDPSVLTAVQNVLAGRAVPCVGLGTALAAAWVPERVAWFERAPGRLARLGLLG